MRNPRLIILADDLTGAADSAVPFASRGLSTRVVLDPDEPLDGDVVSIDTESRSLPIQKAADLSFRSVERFAPAVPLFKKIDSTLRGYVGPECATALRAFRRIHPGASLLVAPAFPAMGRTTIRGEQLVNGNAVGSIPAILERAGLSVAVLPRGDPFPPSVDAWVCDAESDDDLRRILQQAGSCAVPPLLVGTGGLARVLAESFPLQPPLNIPGVSGPILFVTGSVSTAARLQVDALHSSVLRATSNSASLLRGSCDAIVCPSPSGSRDLNPQVSRHLALAIAPYSDRFSALFLTGGATARAVLDTMKITSLQVIGELEPGVPISRASNGLVIVTKAGGFGDAATLERCRQKLRS